MKDGIVAVTIQARKLSAETDSPPSLSLSPPPSPPIGLGLFPSWPGQVKAAATGYQSFATDTRAGGGSVSQSVVSRWASVGRENRQTRTMSTMMMTTATRSVHVGFVSVRTGHHRRQHQMPNERGLVGILGWISDVCVRFRFWMITIVDLHHRMWRL